MLESQVKVLPMAPHDDSNDGGWPREPGVLSAWSRSALTILGVTVLLAGTPAAQACGYHDPSSTSLGMLNWAYPDALHVRTAVWMGQRDGALAPSEPLSAVDPASPQARLQQLMRLRQTQARFDALRSGLDAALAGRPLPAFAVVLIGPLLWTRFEGVDDGIHMVVHVQGPTPDDVVIVTDAPVLAALVDGGLTFRSARERGLARLYGSPDAVERVSALLDHAVRVRPARPAHPLDPVQEN